MFDNLMIEKPRWRPGRPEFAGILWFFLAITIVVAVARGPTDHTRTRNLLSAQGYTNIHTYGWRGPTTLRFKALSISGWQVEGEVWGSVVRVYRAVPGRSMSNGQ